MNEIKTKSIISEPQEKQQRTSLFLDLCKRTVKGPGAKIGGAILAIMVFCIVFANFVAPYGENEMDLTATFATPNAHHLLGCDALGRDLLSRLLYGGRYSLLIGVLVTIVDTTLGVLLGAIAGYFGGMTELIIMRVMEVWQAIPQQLLAILIATIFGGGFWQTVVALSVGGIPMKCRQTRAQFLKESGREYVEAAEAINCTKLSIMMRHIFPNACSPIIITIAMGIGGAVTGAAGLAYIGLGVQPPTPEWGALLNAGRQYIRLYPHLLLWPGVFIAFLVLSFNLIGDGLRDALDPKLRD